MLFLDNIYISPWPYVFVDKRVLLAYALEGITWLLFSWRNVREGFFHRALQV